MSGLYSANVNIEMTIDDRNLGLISNRQLISIDSRNKSDLMKNEICFVISLY